MNHLNKKIILINLNDITAAAVYDYLEEWGYTAIRAKEIDNLKSLIQEEGHALILFQFMEFSHAEFDLFRSVQKNNPSIPIIFTFPFISVKDSFDLGKAGAVDYIVQPFNPNELKRKIERYLSDP